MDLDTPLSSSHPLWTQSTHAEPQRLHQQMQPMKSPGQPQHLDGPQPLAAISRSPTSQSGATLATGPVTMPPSVSPPPAQPRPVSAIGSSTKDPHSNSVVRDQKNEYSYPREPHKVYFDAIERLQIQTAQNTSALAAQARNQIDYTELVRKTEGSLRHEFQTQLHRQDQELRRMDEIVGRLLQELQDCRRSIVSLAQRVDITQRPGEATQPGFQDEALELMARRIGEVSHRTTDLETLRDHMAIVSGRVQRLESESAATHRSHSRPVLPTYQPTHSAHVAYAIAPHTTHVAPFETPSRPTSNPQLMSHNEKPPAVVPPESAQRHESTPVQNGWTTVNAGTKRTHENGTNSPIQCGNSPKGSPKRLRLATGESQEAHAVAQIPPGPSHILPSQTQIVVTSQSQPQSQPGLGQHQGIYPLPSPRAYTPYGIQDGPSEQSWRPESQRVPERPARGRGSRGGRGPGSRGGRVRKSMQGQHHPAGSPDWDRDSWSAVPDTQGSPIVIDDHSPARSIMRRGSGGGGMRGGSSLMERVNDWTPEAGPRSVFHDPPSETKKTRSKPVRNEEGILVRKDGRPDRRSQSSAANLRKVHARKEEQNREGEAGSTPSSLQFSILAGPDTPSPASNGYQEHTVTDRVRKKHEYILGRIFPDGIDTSRKQNDYAHQVFNEDRDHTAHPRARSSRSAKPPPQIKKEHVERSEIAETQIATNGDVDMNDAGSPANGHTQGSAPTPADGPADNIEHGNLQESTGRTRSEQESEMQIPETQAVESSAALAAESV
ncbi:hypothetical protein EJ07DRAFT_155029 [Lizonia empirigonia]|nr:hypothetical protein EJ07DRAFT_155029 [Lizonia empirigonia]